MNSSFYLTLIYMLIGALVMSIGMMGAVFDWDEHISNFISINRVAIAKVIGIGIIVWIMWLSVFWGLFLIGTIVWYYLKYIKQEN